MVQFAILFTLLGHLIQEPPAGIYIIPPENKRAKCENESRMVVGDTKVCLSPRPILAKSVVISASDVSYDPHYKVHYIDVNITPEASRILLVAKKSFPEAKFALALDGKVICVFMIKQDYAIKSFRIGEDATLADLTRIRELMKRADL